MTGRVVPVHQGGAKVMDAQVGERVDDRQPVASGEFGVLDSDFENWTWGDNDEVVSGAPENPEVCEVCA